MATGCTQMRRKLVTHTSFNMMTGKQSPDSRQEWVTEPCNVPMFSADEQTRGTCRSCAAGWTHPNNYPIVENAK